MNGSGTGLGPPAFDPAMGRDEARRRLERAFAQAGVDSAALDARVLLCAALDIDHAGLVRDSALSLGAGAALLQSFAARRLRREPVSRIVGFREFWGSRFALGPAVLDPRPDTETLVEAALEHARAGPCKAARILDLGVGSGAILGALLQGLEGSYGVGVDLSAQACALARQNLTALGLEDRSAIFCGSWTGAVSGVFDLIVSNPPYIARGDIGALAAEVRDYDPILALDGGADGLDVYRAVIPALPALLAPGGAIVLEFGLHQREPVAEVMRAAGLDPCEVRLDLSGCERVLVGRSAA